MTEKDKGVYYLPGHEPKEGQDTRFDEGGGGGDDGGMELTSRVAKLEAAVEHIQTDMADLKADVRGLRADMRADFRILFGAIIGAVLGLAGVMAKGFHWL